MTDTRCLPSCVAPSPTQAHCSSCHRTFGVVANFDRHRRDGHCLDPSALGMVDRDGVWRVPMPPEALAALRADAPVPAGGRAADGRTGAAGSPGNPPVDLDRQNRSQGAGDA